MSLLEWEAGGGETAVRELGEVPGAAETPPPKTVDGSRTTHD